MKKRIFFNTVRNLRDSGKIYLLGVFLLLTDCAIVTAQQSSTDTIALQEYNTRTAEGVKKAKKIYDMAVKNYENGKPEEAQNFYNTALYELYIASMNAEVSYDAKREFDNLFEKLRKSLKIDYSAPASAENTEKHYTIPIDTGSNVVKKFVEYYSATKDGREDMRVALSRSGRYRDMILGILKEYDLPRELIYLPVVESLYNYNDLSHCGALGIWQFMPTTARYAGLKVNYWIDERKDPEKSTRAAAKLLKELYLWFNDWHVALAAYNRGSEGIERDLRFAKVTDFKGLDKHNAIPKETESYVPKFIAAVIVGDNCRDYGLEINFEKPLEYEEVTINNIIDIRIIEQCIESKGSIRALNPELISWCTPNNYPDYTLKLPPGTKDLFLKNIALVKELNPSRGFIRYSVNKGDYLGKIARKFYTTVSDIRTDNNIKKNLIRPGQVLIVKPGKKYYQKSDQG